MKEEENVTVESEDAITENDTDDSSDEKKDEEKKARRKAKVNANIKKAGKDIKKAAKKKVRVPIGLIVVIVVVAIVATLVISKKGPLLFSMEEGKVTYQTKTDLQEILKTEKLYTGKIYYNGVATANNDRGKPKYYVKYEGTVTSGIDCSKIRINTDDEKKTITVHIPKATYQKFDVGSGKSMEFIFVKEKYNKEQIIKEARQRAKEDLVISMEDNKTYLDMATENGERVIKTSVDAIVNADDSKDKYTINVVCDEEEAENNEKQS